MYVCVSAQTHWRASNKLGSSPTTNEASINAKATNPMSTATGNAKLTERPARQPTILVVDDHDDTREMLHTLLEMWGCRVVEACNGLEAVEVAAREKPQLILMDGRLPFIDGLEATRRIRENGVRNQVKIVALNGSGGARYRADALAAGCDESIEKPFDFDWLRTYLLRSSILPLMPRGEGNYSAS